MGLKIVHGRAGSGKSTFCLNMIKEMLEKSQSIENTQLFLLVPEQFTLESERHLIKILGTGGILKTEVLSFKRMAHRVFTDVGGNIYPNINSAGKSIIISRILEEQKQKLDFFRPISTQNGFVPSIATLIKEFKRYNVTADMLKDYAPKVDFVDKLNEIAIIYESFENSLKNNRRDSDDDLTLLFKKLPKTNIFDNAVIWIDEFSGFTPQEYCVVCELLKLAKDVNISFCTNEISSFEESELDVFLPVKRVCRNLIKYANDNNIPINEPVYLNSQPPPRFLESEEISHLERNFFSYPSEMYQKETSQIEVFSAINVYSEVENAAKDIISLCRDNAYRYKDIAVVCRNLDSYQKLIEVIFKSYEIPFFIDKKRDVSNLPIIKFIVSLFEIITGNWSYESVFGYLKTGLAGITIQEIDTIENYILACGIKGYKWTMAGDFKHSSGIFGQHASKEHSQEFFVKINDIRRRITKPILDFCEMAKGGRRPIEISTALYDFLCKLGIPDHFEERIELLRKNGDLQLANEYNQVFGILMEVLDQLVEVLDDKPISIERFSKALIIGLSEYKVGSIPSSLDQVLIGSVDRSRSHQVKALFVLGVNDGVFPSSSFEEGILSDNDRNLLRNMGLHLAEDSYAKAFEEQFLIYKTISTPSKILKISYSVADFEGRAMRPSIIITRLKKIFPKLKILNNLANEEKFNINVVSSRIPTLNYLISEIRKGIDTGHIDSSLLDIYNWYTKSHFKMKCSNMLEGIYYQNQPDNVSTGKINRLYGNPIKASISKFEGYLSCPFSYFLNFGLKAKERKVYKITPPDVGNFLHEVIDKFCHYVQSEKISWFDIERDWANNLIASIVEEKMCSIKNSAYGDSFRNQTLIKRLTRILNRIIWVITEQIRRGNFVPLGYEIEFGENGFFPPIKLDIPGNQVILTGRIDRVDILKKENGTYVRIIDYKSGHKKLNLTDVYYGLQLQLVAYLDSICENGGRDIKAPIMPGGIFYLRLDDPLVKANYDIAPDELEKLIMKQLKMQGLILDDVSVVKDMDKMIDGYSIIIPASITKSNSMGRSSVANFDRFEILRKYVRKLLVEAAVNMQNGDIGIRPFRKQKETACKFCNFISICQFDPKINSNNYKIIPKRNDEEVFLLMGEKLKENEGQ